MHVVLLGCSFPERPEAGVDRVHVRRARALAGRAAVTVVVPTPWAPRGVGGPDGRWARHRATPHHAEIDGIRLLFPRYLQVPGMGAHLQGCPACHEDHDSLRDFLLAT